MPSQTYMLFAIDDSAVFGAAGSLEVVSSCSLVMKGRFLTILPSALHSRPSGCFHGFFRSARQESVASRYAALTRQSFSPRANGSEDVAMAKLAKKAMSATVNFIVWE
jgi:hypothetical protein